jgi:selenocysteine lyase/cysteine desulfurase
MTTLPPELVERLRQDTPGCAERVHLNNAGSALMPRPVLDAVRGHLELEGRIGGYEAADAERPAIERAYGSVAALIGAAPELVAFVENATVAYAQALSAIPWQSGDMILTSRDDYVSNQIMFLSLHRRFGVWVLRAPDAPGGGIDVEAFSQMVRLHRPRLVALTHVPTNSGLVQPVEAIGKACRESGVLYLVDACQSVGQLPVDVAAIGCDFLSATSRKFMRGPRGSGFLYVSRRVLDAGLEPLFPDLHGATWTDADAYTVRGDARRFENWEFAYALVLGTGAAARYAMEIGIPEIAARTAALAALARERLSAAGFRVLDRGPRLCGIVTVEIPGREPEAFQAALHERRINTSVSTRAYALLDFDQKGVAWALRLSPHYYNTDDEIGAAVGVIAELAGRG